MCIQPSPKYPACISTISRCFIMCPCSMHQCTSELHRHHAKYSPNLQNIQLIIWAFIQHFIHITPRSLNIYIAKDHAQAHTPVFICSHQSSLFVHNLWCLALISDQSPRIAIPHLHSLKSIGTWFSFNFFFLIYILFLSPFSFLFFSSYFFMFHVSDLCALIHTIQITISEYFWIFVH